ncbi:MAG TPA: nucleotidyl transferase AbiEii/AbiGii toxin family protein [Chloroflexi bacterium]|nr:nucleotidyl transferase AbiEii/AbiGii toxin family protein [Chloroflexota bacterium]
MKEILLQTIRPITNPLQARNTAREFLQARILVELQRRGAMIPLAFHGGTALRFLFQHGRFSEDLDFSLVGDRSLYDIAGWLRSIRSTLTSEGYTIDVKMNDQKTVNSAFMRFPGLLYDLQLSALPQENLSIKLEVDTNPPDGAGLATTVLRRYYLLQLHHHDQATLFAGKLHAVLQRPYTKGRDIYDLFWYLGDSNFPTPNFLFLNNALQQTGWQDEELTTDNWKSILRSHADQINWDAITTDVAPFLMPGHEASLLTRANFLRLLE